MFISGKLKDKKATALRELKYNDSNWVNLINVHEKEPRYSSHGLASFVQKDRNFHFVQAP